jgi:hypothetical protein
MIQNKIPVDIAKARIKVAIPTRAIQPLESFTQTFQSQPHTHTITQSHNHTKLSQTTEENLKINWTYATFDGNQSRKEMATTKLEIVKIPSPISCVHHIPTIFKHHLFISHK